MRLKKLSIFVVIFLLLLIIWHSGLLKDEKVVSAIETGVRTAVDLLERGTAFLIGKLK